MTGDNTVDETFLRQDLIFYNKQAEFSDFARLPLWHWIGCGERPCLGNATPITPGYSHRLTCPRHRTPRPVSVGSGFTSCVSDLQYVLSLFGQHHFHHTWMLRSPLIPDIQSQNIYLPEQSRESLGSLWVCFIFICSSTCSPSHVDVSQSTDIVSKQSLGHLGRFAFA